ncbi:MAG: cryptochrome/photolyase family protein [Stenotrophomonas sp.]
MPASNIALIWFRRDLRLADNPALDAALAAGYHPVPVYVHAPHEEGNWVPGAASNAWLHRSLAALQADLRQRGSDLLILRGDSLACLRQLIAATGAQAVYWNRRYEPAITVRDTAIKQALREAGCLVRSFNARLLAEPWQLMTGQGTPYKVFTPYWKALSAQLRLPASMAAPDFLPAVPALELPAGLHCTVEQLGLAPSLGWDRGFWERFQPGEAGALEALEAFTDGALTGYLGQRDLPDRTGTSLLSPHLHFGEIAPWCIAKKVNELRNVSNEADLGGYTRQLAWRDFAHYTLHYFPRSSDANLNPRFERMAWNPGSHDFLQAWQQGRTGVPIVDAGMRELWHTGWMHNRVRMIVGSWLCKHMRLHWLHGARWFWDTLIDADLANNSLGWQWIAGTGVDAAPYFRVFNPVTQAQKFDPQARYVSRWVPELARLPVTQRFAPWLAGGVAGYPRQPIVDLAQGRAQALAAYQATGQG